MKELKSLPLDPIFMNLEKFRADKNPRKINLGIGIYADKQGKPYVMPSVVNSAKNLDCSNFNYTSMQGDTEFLDLVQKFVLGDVSREIAQIQTVGGTHAVKLYGNLAKKQGIENYILPTPTWGNYQALLLPEKNISFPHLMNNGEVNFVKYEDTIKDLDDAEKTCLVLQGGQPHNQTGKNLSLEQLKKLIPLINEKKLSVLVDAAYLGLGLEIKFTPSGVEGRDLEFVRTAFREINRVALAVSFSKNACLYRHRCGALFIKSLDSKESGLNFSPREILESHLQVDTRTTISNPPAFGAMVMKDIFVNNFENWLSEVSAMKKSIDSRRELLVNSLAGKVDYLKNCRGMFGVLQVSPEQIQELREKYAIYLLDSGRINFAGITVDSQNYLMESLREIL